MRFTRRVSLAAALLLLSTAPSLRAQAQAAQQTDQFQMTCAKVLAMPSADYIAKYVAIADSNLDGQLRGICRYGKCYDARTDSIAAFLARGRRGPSKPARDDFSAFESALRDFTAKALAAVPPRPGSAKEAYANLYEKQFRRQFYAEFEVKAAPAGKPAAPAPRGSGTTAAVSAAPPSGAKSAAPAPQSADERARSDADPVTQAKNHFGKLLNSLPDDQMHLLHAAFGEVVGPHTMSEAMRLAVYRYAIFLLEPPSAKPFAPPPF